MDSDLQHIRLLGMFHFVVAGLTALFASIPVIHLVVGLGLVTGAFDRLSHDATPAPPEVKLIGTVFVLVAACMILIGWTIAVVIALGGSFLLKRRHHTYCLVAAGLACMLMPFGTVLGVFTLLVLTKERVKALFDVPPEPAAAPLAT